MDNVEVTEDSYYQMFGVLRVRLAALIEPVWDCLGRYGSRGVLLAWALQYGLDRRQFNKPIAQTAFSKEVGLLCRLK